ncbi:MAG TPA: hypothetical protein VFW20_04370 [Candidatus Limnocylindrales bacterium]|nr:hypothetical protein [Candidatus Limnocylindrales bacterium]
MSGSRNVVLRPYETRDLEGTLRLRPRLYPGWPEATDREWHQAVFEWLGRGPSGEPMHRWVLDHDGEIVGHLAGVPLPYRIGGQRVVAYTPTDYMALPGYGFHSVGLMRTFFRTCPNYLACNVVGDASAIEGLFHPARVGRLTHGLKILELGSYPRLPARVPRVAATLGGRVVRGIDAILLGAAGSGGMTVTEESTTAFDARFDRLFEAVAAAVPCTVERSAAFLRWRYGPGTPREPFRLLTVAERAAERGPGDLGELAGYAVLRTTTHDEGFVMDLTTLPGRPDVARALLAAGIRRFWADRAFVVRYRYLPSAVTPAPRDLRRLGFALRSDGGRALPGIQPERQLELLVRLAAPEAQAVAARADHWTYNLGDGEASFWVH